jgi:hypothetical protein
MINKVLYGTFFTWLKRNFGQIAYTFMHGFIFSYFNLLNNVTFLNNFFFQLYKNAFSSIFH